jgi:hypothetical protein
MGEAATRKVTEIEETRQRLEADLRDLEDRMPASLRSGKAIVGMLVGTVSGALVLRRILSRRSERTPPTEVVIRVVREDQGSSTGDGQRTRRGAATSRTFRPRRRA